MKKIINKLEQNLEFKISNIELYGKAITHKSADKINNYEKLEFLGDRVLGLCISKKLLEIFPNEKEGILDKKLASLVNKNKCFEIGNFLELDKIIKIGNLRLKKQIIEKKIISDSCEALIGAIYLDKGFDFVEKFILKIWNKHMSHKYYFSIAAMFKNESWTLKEWIEHYKLHGADHIYLVDDFSDDDFLPILQPYIDSGYVTLFKSDVSERFTGRQIYVTNKYFLPIAKESKWIAQVDVDEFLYSPKVVDIKEVLKKYDSKID